jgi:hypothetical protein
MSTRWHLSYFSFFLCLFVVVILSGCASRKVVTSSGDQRYVPGATAQAPMAEAKTSPPVTPPAVKESTGHRAAGCHRPSVAAAGASGRAESRFIRHLF